VSVTKIALEILAARLREDLARASEHATELSEWRDRAPEGHEAYAAAYLLHHFYTAIEAIIERALLVFDGALPIGEDSHIQLLEQAAREVRDVRPVILPTNRAVDELRRFRHHMRKRYDVDLDPARLHRVVRVALEGWPGIREDLAAFVAFVDECIKEAE
jgi:hypothetical protein